MTTQNAQKSNAKKIIKNPTMCNHSFQVIIGIDSLKHKQTQLLLELLDTNSLFKAKLKHPTIILLKH